MSEKKYYVGLKVLIDGNVITHFLWKDHCFYRGFEKSRCSFTKSELAEIMDGVLYRTFTHQFHPQLAEELYKLGYRTTQTTEEWIEARYEFDNIWEWINPLIELVPVEELRC